MIDRKTNLVVPTLVALVAALMVAAPARAEFQFRVTIDSASIPSGTSGEIYFQFNPGGANFQQATAVVSDLQSQGVTYTGGTTDGDASLSGPLPGGTLTLENDALPNYLLENVTFGSASDLSFDVTLSGPAVNAPNGNPADVGTSFFFGVLDTNFNPLLPAGAGVDPLIDVTITGGSGAITVQDTSPVAVVTTGVAEPGSMTMLALGVTVVAASARRIKRRARAA